jgi:hypothetical protein
MSKRNIILLIIVLTLTIAVVFGFLYFYQPKTKVGETGGNTNFFANFFPFGNNENTTSDKNTDTPTDVSGYIPPDETQVSGAKLKKISSFPIAGFGIFMKERFKDVENPNLAVSPPSGGETANSSLKPTAPPTEFVPALRYVERSSGIIYQTFADRLDERKFSSTIIPRVYEAYFGNKGESVVMRYLKEDDKTIQTFVGVIPKEYLGADSSGANEIKGSFLPENITDLSISPDNSRIFYIFNNVNTVVGVTLTLSTNTKVQVFDSRFSGWLSSWPNNKIITMTTKPSYNVKGFAYTIDIDRKDFNRVLGDINGLTTLTSPDGKMILYSDNNLSLSIFNVNTNSGNVVGIKTLPEKCVWGQGSDVIYCAVPKSIDRGAYPDSWYTGEVSFSDEIWAIDSESGNTTLILNPSETQDGEDIDAIKPSLDKDQNYLFFINKKDSYLWKLDLR